jgi:hypothetical protein
MKDLEKWDSFEMGIMVAIQESQGVHTSLLRKIEKGVYYII